MKHISLVSSFFAMISISAMGALPVGQMPKKIVLEGEKGGKISGAPWDSSQLTGKVSLIVYTTKDEKDTNNAASKAIKEQGFPEDQFQSYGIANLEPTWYLPNTIMELAIKEKQKENPRTIMVKDVHRSLVKEWGLKDESSDYVVLDPMGRVVYSFDGKLDNSEIEKLLAAIRNNLPKSKIKDPETNSGKNQSLPKK